MWMLNYLFDYDGVVVVVWVLVDQVLVMFEVCGMAVFEMEVFEYVVMCIDFFVSLIQVDVCYYDFQVWKEGVVCWSELVIICFGWNDVCLVFFYV